MAEGGVAVTPRIRSGSGCYRFYRAGPHFRGRSRGFRAGRRPAETLVRMGKRLFETIGCFECHGYGGPGRRQRGPKADRPTGLSGIHCAASHAAQHHAALHGKGADGSAGGGHLRLIGFDLPPARTDARNDSAAAELDANGGSGWPSSQVRACFGQTCGCLEFGVAGWRDSPPSHRRVMS